MAITFSQQPVAQNKFTGENWTLGANVTGEGQNLQQTLVHDTSGGYGSIYVDKTNGWVYHGYGISNVAKLDRSKDGGQNWTNIYSDSSVQAVRSIWAEGDFILIGTGNVYGKAKVFKSTSATPSFSQVWSGAFGPLTTENEAVTSIVRFANGDFCFSFGDTGARIFVGDSTGQNFVAKKTYTYSASDTSTFTTAWSLAVNGNTAICTIYHFSYTNAHTAKIVHTEDAGQTWTEYTIGSVGTTYQCCFSLGYWWVHTRKAGASAQNALYKIATTFSAPTLVQDAIATSYYGIVGLTPTSQGVAMVFPAKVEHFGDWRNTTTLTLSRTGVIGADIYGKKIYVSTGFNANEADVFSFVPQIYSDFSLYKTPSTLINSSTETDGTYSYTDVADISDVGDYYITATNAGTTITSDTVSVTLKRRRIIIT